MHLGAGASSYSCTSFKSTLHSDSKMQFCTGANCHSCIILNFCWGFLLRNAMKPRDLKPRGLKWSPGAQMKTSDLKGSPGNPKSSPRSHRAHLYRFKHNWVAEGVPPNKRTEIFKKPDNSCTGIDHKKLRLILGVFKIIQNWLNWCVGEHFCDKARFRMSKS